MPLGVVFTILYVLLLISSIRVDIVIKLGCPTGTYSSISILMVLIRVPCGLITAIYVFVVTDTKTVGTSQSGRLL